MKQEKILFLFEAYGDYCNGNYERFKHFKDITEKYVNKINLRNFFKKHGRNYFFVNFINMIVRNKIETLVFANAPWMYIDLHQIINLKKYCKIIFIVDDCEEYFEWYQLPFAKLSDRVLVHDFKDVNLFKKNNIDAKFFPQPSLLTDLLKSKQVKYENKKFDIFFLGRSDRPGRKKISYDFSKITNSVYFKYSNLEKIKISNKEKLKIMLQSKIHINFSAASSNKSYFSSYKESKVSNNLKGRIFEAILSGSLVVTENSPGIDKIFNVSESIFVFNHEEEMKNVINKILNHEFDINKHLINSKNCISKYFSKSFYDDCFDLLKEDNNFDISNIYDKYYEKFLRVYIAKESLRLLFVFTKMLKLKFAFFEIKNFFYHLNSYFFVYIYYYLKTLIFK